MKLRTIFDLLSEGELSQIDMGGAEAGLITEDKYPKVARMVNLGLTDLHKRFLLKEGTVNLTLQTGMTTYVLDGKYAADNIASLEPVKYLDSFADNLFKIERVYNDAAEYESERELPLNDYDNADSVLTPGYKTLVVPADLEATVLRVMYRANHPELAAADWLDPDACEIDLPYSHVQALLLYVGCRMLNPSGFTGGNGFHEGNNYMAKYEAEVASLDSQNLRIDIGTSHRNTRLERNGWV